ncbi:hypothetical protein C817_01897 [Dorea sp. 5-2]|nr:hypothetical protein C817_01897 [Dorea sp. 5-2]
MPIPQERIYTSEDYRNLPDGQRAELIDGKLYAMAPPDRMHQKILGALYSTIYNRIKQQKGSREVYPAPFAINLIANDKIWVEPDISIICDPNKLNTQGCTGAPDWIIEIVSPGNPEHDYIRKLNLYKDAGVCEYWIVDPRNGKVFVYFFDQDKFNVDSYTFHDKIKVNIYDDFWIDFQELNLF